MKRLLCAALLLAACARHATLRSSAAPATRALSEQHCLHYLTSRTGPLCLHALSEEQAQHSNASYLLRYEDGHVVSALRINGHGTPEPDEDDECDFRYRYDKDLLVETTARDIDGNIRARTLRDAGHSSAVDEWGRPLFHREHESTKTALELDARGLVLRERYFGPDDKPARNGDGAYENRYERDAAGAALSICNFDAQGRAMRDRYGVHCYRFKRNAFELSSERLTFDEQGQPIANARGITRVASEFDAYGNVVHTRWYTAPNLPYDACAQQTSYYDAFGGRVGADCLDEQGKPKSWLVGHSAWRVTFDERGLLLESRNFDAHGALTRVDAGWARREYEHDAHGHVTRTRYFLEDGSPGQTDGPAIVENRYDGRGLMIQASYFDARHEPTRKRGCYARSWSYDDFRQATSQHCLDADGGPQADSNGAASERYVYDERGLPTQTRYFDERDRPVDTRDGYQTATTHYDSGGRKLAATLRKADGSERKLPRFRHLAVRFAYSGVAVRGPSRETALARIAAARAELAAGRPFEEVLMRYAENPSPLRDPGDMGYGDLQRFYQAARVALEKLELNQVSAVVELPFGFVLYQRSE